MSKLKVIGVLGAVVFVTLTTFLFSAAAYQIARLDQEGSLVLIGFASALTIGCAFFVFGLSFGRWKPGAPAYIGKAVFLCFLLTAFSSARLVLRVDFVNAISSIKNH
jgi:hypothetical protein